MNPIKTVMPQMLFSSLSILLLIIRTNLSKNHHIFNFYLNNRRFVTVGAIL